MNNKLLVFMLDNQSYALALSAVERVVRAVEVTRLPAAPEIVAGVINVQGRIIPVVSLRLRFGLPEKAIALSDQLVLIQTSKWTLALVADEVTGVIECPDENLIKKEDILPGADYVTGVVKLKKGMVLIADIESFLRLDEDMKLEAAIR